MAIFKSAAPHMELMYIEKPNGTEDSNKWSYHRINFGDVAERFSAMGYGFGIQRIDFNRGTRKTIQQTRGIEKSDGTIKQGSNFYEDIWYTSPPKLVLGGIVEMPAARDIYVAYWDETNVNGKKQNMTFLQIIEQIFLYNNIPSKSRYGDELKFNDFMRKQYYNVSIKDFNTTASVERQNLLEFNINMEVLYEVPLGIMQNITTTDQVISSLQGTLSDLLPFNR